MQHRVVTLPHGEPQYMNLLSRIRRDPALVAAMLADADSRPEEMDIPGTRWTVAVVGGQPAAWCAAQVQADGLLKCHSNYEHPHWRGRGLYEAAYRERHRMVIAPSRRTAVTYLYEAPIGLHLSDGWRMTGLCGTSPDTGYDWWELRRDPN